MDCTDRRAIITVNACVPYNSTNLVAHLFSSFKIVLVLGLIRVPLSSRRFDPVVHMNVEVRTSVSVAAIETD